MDSPMKLSRMVYTSEIRWDSLDESGHATKIEFNIKIPRVKKPSAMDGFHTPNRTIKPSGQHSMASTHNGGGMTIQAESVAGSPAKTRLPDIRQFNKPTP